MEKDRLWKKNFKGIHAKYCIMIEQKKVKGNKYKVLFEGINFRE